MSTTRELKQLQINEPKDSRTVSQDDSSGDSHELIIQMPSSMSSSGEARHRTRSSTRKEDEVTTKLDEDENGHTHGHADLRGDYHNICLLVFLYVLQGIPLGLAGSLPLILQNRKVSYAQQAIFSFVNWPFSVKLLWAPVVDSIFNARFGRRKSWLIPTQYLIGLFMFSLSYFINDMLGDESSSPSIYLLTFTFLCLDTLAATQDIAVDGWALTMLKKRNVGYASTCNTVGQTMGYFMGNVIFLALESGSFCNKFLWFMYRYPSTEGLVTLSSFLYFWGIVFLISTTFVMIIKKESRVDGDGKMSDEDELGLWETYQMLYKILKLPAVQLFVLILFTCKIGFSTSDAISGLKLIEYGVKKEHLAMLAVPVVPLQLTLPWLFSKWTAGPRPLSVFLKAYPWRLSLGVVSAVFVYWTTIIRDPVTDSFPLYYYGVLLLVYASHQVTVYAIYVSLMSFHAKTADPCIGGTYMTLLNTLTNLGGNWPSTLALSTVEYLNIKSCTEATAEGSPEVCSIVVDGFFIQMVITTVIGFLWLRWGHKKLEKIQRLPSESWLVVKK